MFLEVPSASQGICRFGNRQGFCPVVRNARGILPRGVRSSRVPLGRSLSPDAVQSGPRLVRFPGHPVRTEQGKMLASMARISQPAPGMSPGWEHLADGDAGTPVAGVDLFEVAGGGRIAHGARHRITRHPTLEPVDTAGQLLLAAFTEEIDMGDDFRHRCGKVLCADRARWRAARRRRPRILIWLPTCPASATEGSASFMHSLIRLQVKGDSANRSREISSTTPIRQAGIVGRAAIPHPAHHPRPPWQGPVKRFENPAWGYRSCAPFPSPAKGTWSEK